MMEDKQKIQPRKSLQQIQPYSPGKPIWEVQKELGLDRVIKLASNENPLGPSPMAIEEISKSINGINRYPDADATHVKEMISKQLHVQTQQLIVTNGADELITLISEAYLEEGLEIIVPSPSFSEYDFGAHVMGASVVAVPLGENYEYDIEAILSAISERTKIVYICSPNNPTGTYLAKAKLQQLLDSVPEQVLVVFDGAYSHYAKAEDYTNGLEFVEQGYPIIVLHTFSKIYGLAGVRIGYGVASQEIVKDILKVKEPFNVNTIAQVAATAAIADEKHVNDSQAMNENGRNQMYEAFSKLGIHYIESMSNFVLVHIGPNAKHVYEQLMAKGIIVRYGGIWGLTEHLRISVGTTEENEILLETIGSIIKRDLP